jgi:hypothetical protein
MVRDAALVTRLLTRVSIEPQIMYLILRSALTRAGLSVCEAVANAAMNARVSKDGRGDPLGRAICDSPAAEGRKR